MLFLDTSAIIAYNRDDSDVVSYLDGRQPWFTSTICVFEVVNGLMWADGKSAHVARQGFGGVRSIDLSETIAMEAARMQEQLRKDGVEMAMGDLLIAATARSTGAELVVADDDFETEHLHELLTVTNLDH